MLPTEIFISSLHMERTQLRLGLVISSMIMLNSTLLLGSMNPPARFAVPVLAFVFSAISQYFLVRQSLERSDGNLQVLKELGASHTLLFQTLLVNVVLVGLIGSIAGFVLGIGAIFSLQVVLVTDGLLGTFPLGITLHLLLLTVAALCGITAGSYQGIRTTLNSK